MNGGREWLEGGERGPNGVGVAKVRLPNEGLIRERLRFFALSERP